jgi:hypothetical protein
MRRRCLYKRPDGMACRAKATARSEFCFFHDPELAADRREAQRAGGLRNKAVSLPSDTPDSDLKNVGDVIVLLAMTINQVRRGQIDPRISNAVGYLSATLLKAFEIGDLERRISDVEKVTSNRTQSDLLLDADEFYFIQEAPDDRPEPSHAR